MTTIKARYDGKVFVPEQPVDLPSGFILEIPIPTAGDASTLAKLAKIAERYPDNPQSPTDLAAQHDHYLYGVPKRP